MLTPLISLLLKIHHPQNNLIQKIFTSQDPDDDPSTSEDEPTDEDETNDDTEEFHMQPYGMQSNLPFPIIESMNQFDTLQA